jgi:hypothetical protein
MKPTTDGVDDYLSSHSDKLYTETITDITSVSKVTYHNLNYSIRSKRTDY